MRLGHKTKKALRIGAKVGGIGVALLGGARLGSKKALEQIHSGGVEALQGEPRPLGVATAPSPSLTDLNVKASNLLGGAQRFNQLSSQVAQLSQQSGQFNRRYRG